MRHAMIYFEDLKVGAETDFGTYDVTREEVLEFATKYDPQPFHLSDEAAAKTHFGRIAASGWHTAAMTMRMLVDSVPLADGLIGAELQLAWPRPTRPGMILQLFAEVVDIRPSRSKPDMAIVTMRNETRDQDGEVLQLFTVKMPVFKRVRG